MKINFHPNLKIQTINAWQLNYHSEHGVLNLSKV